jgi:Arc/MetJ-type ribon-helix-helix transcriptional regulator
MINIALTDDLQRLLRKKVETGEFPNEEAVVEEALKCFLIQEPSRGRPQPSTAAEVSGERLPGPFLEDETALAPVELPRPSRETACSSLQDATRQPDLFPGE